jgi:large subunit ribosomal protein L29
LKTSELREMDSAEIQRRLSELQEEVFHLRLRRASAKLENPRKLVERRRDIARILTLLRERSLGIRRESR